MMDVLLLLQKPLCKGVTLRKQRWLENAVDLTLGPGELTDSPPPLAIHKEGWAIPEFAARVVVCVENLKQTRASCSQMWGLSGSLTVPGVLEVKAAHARSAFHREAWRHGAQRNLISSRSPSWPFCATKATTFAPSPSLIRKHKFLWNLSNCHWISNSCSKSDKPMDRSSQSHCSLILATASVMSVAWVPNIFLQVHPGTTSPQAHAAFPLLAPWLFCDTAAEAHLVLIHIHLWTLGELMFHEKNLLTKVERSQRIKAFPPSAEWLIQRLPPYSFSEGPIGFNNQLSWQWPTW